GNDHVASAADSAGVETFLKRACILRRAVAGSAEVSHVVALRLRIGAAFLLSGRSLIEFRIRGKTVKCSIYLLSKHVFVGEVENRGPVFLGEGVAMFGIVHAKAILCAEKLVSRLRAEDRLPHRLGQRNGVGITFQGDERSRRAESQKPMLVEWKFFP